jgi:hypothetical protein
MYKFTMPGDEKKGGIMNPLDTFLNTFNQLDKNNLSLLETIYHPDIRFIDPAHSLEGLPALKQYFFSLYENVRSIRFAFDTPMQSGSQAFVTWTLHMNHPRLAKGRPVAMQGCSCLTFASDGRVIRHRDYFDLGAMIYEHLPLVGGIIKTIKKRLGS